MSPKKKTEKHKQTKSTENESVEKEKDKENNHEVVAALGSDPESTLDTTTGASQASFAVARGGAPATPPDPGGPPRREDLAVEPEELGRRILESATQDPHPETDAQKETPSEALRDERRRPRRGEMRMREEILENPDSEDRLIQELPNRSEVDDRVSQKSKKVKNKGELPAVPEKRGKTGGK